MHRVKYRGIERRKFYRLESAVDVGVTILSDDEELAGPKSFAAKSKNISLEGICLETRQVEVDGVHILTGSPKSPRNRLDLAIDLYHKKNLLKFKEKSAGMTWLGKRKSLFLKWALCSST